MDNIVIKGAREHNLKNVDVTIPKNKLVVFTGVSGSGKSSLAFDTIYVEGRRRYVESLSSYARMFLQGHSKSDVESIEGLSPAIAIEQKSVNNNPRSTVGTLTEIYDYYRLLWSKIGKMYCPNCGHELSKVDIDQIIDFVFENPDGIKIAVSAPVVIDRKTEGKRIFDNASEAGFKKAIVNGQMIDISNPPELDKKFKYNISIVIDRIVINHSDRTRLSSSIETALDMANGIVEIAFFNDSGNLTTSRLFSQRNTCPQCGTTSPELELRLFSFNSPIGACPECNGLGLINDFDIDKIVPDMSKSFIKNAVLTNKYTNKTSKAPIDALAKTLKFDLSTPIGDLPKDIFNIMFYEKKYPLIVPYITTASKGGKTEHWFYEGIIPELQRRQKQNSFIKGFAEWYNSFCTEQECTTCHGKRLNRSALSVLIGGKNISEVLDLSVEDSIKFFSLLELSQVEREIAKDILKAIFDRLNFLKNVGLSYLTLSRLSGTLSGGEAQRIRLASQLGSALTGVLYVLDEPSIGLHQRDNDRLIQTLKSLRDLGNTIVVVEHDEDVIRNADYIVDVGPFAGELGGKIVATGSVDDIISSSESITGAFLGGREKIETPIKRRDGNGKKISLKQCCKNNLKNIDVDIPLGKLVCITGVSGSGKSTLLEEVLVPSVQKCLTKTGRFKKAPPVNAQKLTGAENINRVIVIDQNPIGRTPRSNPATYVEVFSDIRDLFAKTLKASSQGWGPGRFSFNVPGGRCENCQGDGQMKIEMHFLPDVYVQCDVCEGKRYNKETLSVTYKGKNIAEVLDMTMSEALEFFSSHPKIKSKLQTVVDVGLGYIKLGQSALELSGGEAQRVKLALELSKKETGKTLYILDEPTTGLHFADVKMLLKVLDELVDRGNTVVLIEHNLDVIKRCDYLIDLGPEGGTGGGQVVATGTPEEICKNENSWTGKYLKKYL